MFAVIYRAYLKPDTEKDYQQAWDAIASHFIAECGAQGSCLHKTADNIWLAYSRWPSKALRDAFWSDEDKFNQAIPEPIRVAIQTIKACIDRERLLPDIEMDVVNDKILK